MTATPYPYQETAARHIVDVLKDTNAAVDLSDTGVGKTYTAARVAQLLGHPPLLVVCPLSVVPAWKSVLQDFGVEALEVLNPERLKTWKTQWVTRLPGKKKFAWRLPPKSLLIVDEAHRFGGAKTINGYLLSYAKAYNVRVLMLSATLADSPLRMRAPGFLLGLHGFRDFYSWCKDNGCSQNPWGGLEFCKGPTRTEFLLNLNKQILPAKGVRVRISDLPDFPECATFAESYDFGAVSKDIVSSYDQMMEELEDENQLVLTVILRARQKVELLKLPLLLEFVEDTLDEGKSVVVFFSFRESLNTFRGMLPPDIGVSFLHGDQKDRKENIERFQNDESRVMLATIGAGGVGVSLHDVRGEFPRVSFITPPYSAVDLKQALGRIHRQGARSKAIQKILFAAGTVEEEACKAVKHKLSNISLLQDGDLFAGVDIKEQAEGEET